MSKFKISINDAMVHIQNLKKKRNTSELNRIAITNDLNEINIMVECLAKNKIRSKER